MSVVMLFMLTMMAPVQIMALAIIAVAEFMSAVIAVMIAVAISGE